MSEASESYGSLDSFKRPQEIPAVSTVSKASVVVLPNI